jgi:hypothetical protein
MKYVYFLVLSQFSKDFNTVVDFLYEYCVGHCSLPDVYLMYILLGLGCTLFFRWLVVILTHLLLTDFNLSL